MGLFSSNPDPSVEPLEEQDLKCPYCDNILNDGGVITKDLFDATYNTYPVKKYKENIASSAGPPKDEESANRELRKKNRLAIGIGCPHCQRLLGIRKYREVLPRDREGGIPIDHIPITPEE